MKCNHCQNHSCLSGCGFLNTYDWFGNMLPPGITERENLYEVQFKSTRKGFYRNVHAYSIPIGSFVVVEADRGTYDVGRVVLGGIAAFLQKKKKKFREDRIMNILRPATENDLKKLRELRAREPQMLLRTREIVKEMGLKMKMTDVEYQGDGKKAIFYYTAEGRVDFRELIKVLAKEFRLRVEMKQIGLRQESGLLGGYGSCGRPLCCSTFLTQFESVSVVNPRIQGISVNPSKITGLCGRLKCCLNYELDQYLEIYHEIPDIPEFMTAKGKVVRKKIEILRKRVWYAYEDNQEIAAWIPLEMDTLKTLADQLNQGIQPPDLESLNTSHPIDTSFTANIKKKRFTYKPS